MTTIAEIRKRLGMDSRVRKVKCHKCGKELEVPNMFSEKDRQLLIPYCPTAVILTIQWLIKHGWHATNREANPPGAYLCPDCYEGQPEYRRSKACDEWCEQAEAWMKENNGKR